MKPLDAGIQVDAVGPAAARVTGSRSEAPPMPDKFLALGDLVINEDRIALIRLRATWDNYRSVQESLGSFKQEITGQTSGVVLVLDIDDPRPERGGSGWICRDMIQPHAPDSGSGTGGIWLRYPDGSPEAEAVRERFGPRDVRGSRMS